MNGGGEKKCYPALNWAKDKNKDEDQLFERVLGYCTEQLMLSSTIFTGERQFFKDYICQINLSGGREWHNPTYALTLSLLHSLQPQQLDEHIILYHGVKNNSYYQQIFKSKLRPGPGQAYQGQRGKNPKLVVPKGIYGSQFLNVTMGYVDQNFPIVIQFAAKDYVQSSNKTYFIVQQAIPLKLVFPFSHPKRSQQFL